MIKTFLFRTTFCNIFGWLGKWFRNDHMIHRLVCIYRSQKTRIQDNLNRKNLLCLPVYSRNWHNTLTKKVTVQGSSQLDNLWDDIFSTQK